MTNINNIKIISRQNEFSSLNGMLIKHDNNLNNRVEYLKIKKDSYKIAVKLKKGGVNIFTKDNLALVSPLTGQAIYLQNYRNQSIVPIVAFRKAMNGKKLFSAFLQSENNNQVFTIVLKCGWVRVDEYREHHRDFIRKINNLDKRMERSGVEMLLYKVERTPKIKDGESFVNLHVHVTYRINDEGSEDKLLEYITSKFYWMSEPQKVQVDEYERMSNYMHKPDILNADGFDIVTLANQQMNLHFIQSKHSFRRFISEINRRRLRPSQDVDGNIRLVKKYTRLKLDMPPNQRLHNRKNHVLRATRPMAIGDDNRLVSALLVRNYDGDFDDLLRKPHVESFVGRVRKQAVINSVDLTR